MTPRQKRKGHPQGYDDPTRKQQSDIEALTAARADVRTPTSSKAEVRRGGGGGGGWHGRLSLPSGKDAPPAGAVGDAPTFKALMKAVCRLGGKVGAKGGGGVQTRRSRTASRAPSSDGRAEGGLPHDTANVRAMSFEPVSVSRCRAAVEPGAEPMVVAGPRAPPPPPAVRRNGGNTRNELIGQGASTNVAPCGRMR